MDKNNLGPSYITSLGDHTGGSLWTEDQGVLDCKDKWCLFNGNAAHATQKVHGPERISFIAFTHEMYNKLPRSGIAADLKKLGFTAECNSTGAECAYFGRWVELRRKCCNLLSHLARV